MPAGPLTRSLYTPAAARFSESLCGTRIEVNSTAFNFGANSFFSAFINGVCTSCEGGDIQLSVASYEEIGIDPTTTVEVDWQLFF
jgi:hypothetical protein